MTDISVVQATGSFTAASTLVVSFLGYLPPMLGAFGSGLGIIWFLLQIYKDQTFQNFIHNLKTKKQARKLARLRARERVVIAKIDAIEKVRSAHVEARELVAHEKAEAAKIIVQEKAETSATLPPL